LRLTATAIDPKTKFILPPNIIKSGHDTEVNSPDKLGHVYDSENEGDFREYERTESENKIILKPVKPKVSMNI
jgi:hypothetical protein